MKVRPYTAIDLPAMIHLGQKMHAESDFAPFSYDYGALENLDALFRAQPEACTAFVATVEEPVETIIGMFVLILQPFFFSLRDRYAADLLLYVDQEHRGGLAAHRLLRAGEKWAWSQGVQQCRFGAATGINPDVADRFFTGMGYRKGGVLYTKLAP